MLMRSVIPIVTVFVTAVLLMSATGCQHQDWAERRARMRRDKVAWTVNTIERGEASRPARMGRTLTAIDRRARLDARNTARNGERVEHQVRRNFRRWHDRQPYYRKGIDHHFLRRRPENIEPTAIILFW